MYTELIKLALALVNYVNERAKNDPIAADKIRKGEPLDNEDLLRLGIDRNLSGADLDAAIEEAGG